LSNFKKFINQVEKNHKGYSKKDWEKADKKYELYSKKLYQRFKTELNFDDELIIVQYKTKYNFYRYKEKSKDAFLNLMESASEAKEHIRYQIESGMEDGVDFLKEKSDRVKEVISTTIDDIFRRFDNNHEK
jgi:hypothetical protein